MFYKNIYKGYMFDVGDFTFFCEMKLNLEDNCIEELH